MKKTKEAETISTVAKNYGISIQEVREEMRYAIDMAIENVEFEKIFGKGVRPSLEEFIRVISETVKHEAEKK